MINADALSDLILALVCSTLAATYWRTRPALAQASGVFAIAASFGVLRFSAIDFALGPHRFFSLVAASAAFPLLAIALCWPDDETAKRDKAAARMLFLLVAIGIAIHLSGFALWRQILPVVSVLMMVIAASRSKQAASIFGALFFVAGLLVAALGQAPEFVLGPFNATQAMHYLMGAGFAMLGWSLYSRTSH